MHCPFRPKEGMCLLRTHYRGRFSYYAFYPRVDISQAKYLPGATKTSSLRDYWLKAIFNSARGNVPGSWNVQEETVRSAGQVNRNIFVSNGTITCSNQI
ncbi:MAG: hypothetical protein JW798_14975 [Prolixibacteraceae bacterium]|nr:hypothetical protein [Prolixibacteraceae bacterium]